jgi:hypothetical protein
MAHVQITRKYAVPETPSPLFPDGCFLRSGFLDSTGLKVIHDMVNNPAPEFKRDVDAVYIDAVKVYPRD